MAERTENTDLIWITEAMVRYHHSRGWFRNRMQAKLFKTVQLPGETKIYLYQREIEEYLRNHPEDDARH
jgi:hypothetical protein